VAKRERTFAEIVNDVEQESSQPPATPPVRGPGRTPDGDLVAPDGRYFRQVRGQIAPSDAAQLVAEADIVVAIDDCGCGGFCGYEWLDSDDIERLRRAGNPLVKSKKKHHPAGSLSDWRDDAGRPLLLIEGEVRWT
jgi:hypothetical protein